MKFSSLMLFVISLLCSYTVAAESAAKQNAGLQDVDMLKIALHRSMPGVKPTRISKTPVEGLYEVIVGSQVVYMSKDARYMIEGDLYDMITKRNISEEAKADIRLAVVDQFGADKMLIYKPEKVSHTITVITDIDCPYCRRLHNEVPDYMANDVEVRYIFMPLKGSDDMKKTISVWCSDDQHMALDIAKAGGEVEAKSCDNPIDEQLKLARALGVRGTPAILLEDGSMLPGYVPYKKLLAELNK